MVGNWTSYREFCFDDQVSQIRGGDSGQVLEIATYLRDNPSLQVGIDGAVNSRYSNTRDRDLSGSRVASVRDALIQAGVAGGRIRTGAFGNSADRGARCVEVLLVSAR
jgi:outer membrane protein OmpA-like peptidoglycan-associated protein